MVDSEMIHIKWHEADGVKQDATISNQFDKNNT